MNKIIYQNQYLTISETDNDLIHVSQRNGGVVIIPLCLDNIILIEHVRNGERLIEFPRGFLEEGEDHSCGAERELFEELGVKYSKIEILGTLLTDSGLISDNIKVALCDIKNTDDISVKKEEGILSYGVYSMNDVIEMVSKGVIRDNFTLASLMLLFSSRLRV